jgi:transposase
MIPIPSGVRVWLATGHTDMRRGMNGLALQIQEVLKRDPYSGHLFVFRGRRGDLIKVLWHDTQGTCLFSKRLERGRFIWPSPAEGVVTITPAQLGYLLEGIDWRAPQRTWRPQAAG